MNPRVYDLSMLAGVCLVTSGVWLMAGLPAALIAAGTLVIGLTAYGARR